MVKGPELSTWATSASLPCFLYFIPERGGEPLPAPEAVDEGPKTWVLGTSLVVRWFKTPCFQWRGLGFDPRLRN